MKETNKIMQEFPPTKEMPCFLLLTMNILEKPSIVGYMVIICIIYLHCMTYHSLSM